MHIKRYLSSTKAIWFFTLLIIITNSNAVDEFHSNEVLEKIATDFNKSNSGMMVDSETRLDKVLAGDRVLEYNIQ